MIALGVSYETGVLITACLFGAVVLAYIIYCLGVTGYNYVEDTHKAYWVLGSYSPSAHEVVLCILMLLFLGMLGSLAWPLFYPGMLIFSALWAMRKFRRFQKKVEKALEAKK